MNVQMDNFKIRLNIDTEKQAVKPSDDKLIKQLRVRLCNSKSIREVTPEQLIQSVEMGLSFTPAAMKGTKSDSWESQQVICVDIDRMSLIYVTVAVGESNGPYLQAMLLSMHPIMQFPAQRVLLSHCYLPYTVTVW